MTTPTAKQNAQAIRQARVKRLGRRAMVFVLLPTLLAIVHYGFGVSSQYASVGAVALTVPAVAQGAGQQTTADAAKSSSQTLARTGALVLEYSRSRQMFIALDKALGLKKHYQDAAIDWSSRLASDASEEATYAYMKDKVSVRFDPKSGLFLLSVHAFEPKMAQTFVNGMVKVMRAYLQDLNAQASKQRLEIVEKQMKDAAARWDASRKVSAQVPSKEAATKPGATGDSNQGAVPVASAASVESLEGERARADYRSASARFRLLREQAALAPTLLGVTSASLPDAASKPKRLWGIVTVFVVASLMMIVFSLLIASIREHANF